MFEVGKCYAQFCVLQDWEFVFVDRIDEMDEKFISMLGLSIDNNSIIQESQTWCLPFDDEHYVEIEKDLFEEVQAILGDNLEYANSEIATKYLLIFKRLCEGNFRNADQE